MSIVPVERRRATSAKASAGGTSEEMEKTTDETTTEANAKRKSTGATPLLVVNLEKGTVKMAKNRKKDKAKLQARHDGGETIGGEINRHGIGENRPTRRG